MKLRSSLPFLLATLVISSSCKKDPVVPPVAPISSGEQEQQWPEEDRSVTPPPVESRFETEAAEFQRGLLPSDLTAMATALIDSLAAGQSEQIDYVKYHRDLKDFSEKLQAQAQEVEAFLQQPDKADDAEVSERLEAHKQVLEQDGPRLVDFLKHQLSYHEDLAAIGIKLQYNADQTAITYESDRKIFLPSSLLIGSPVWTPAYLPTQTLIDYNQMIHDARTFRRGAERLAETMLPSLHGTDFELPEERDDSFSPASLLGTPLGEVLIYKGLPKDSFLPHLLVHYAYRELTLDDRVFVMNRFSSALEKVAEIVRRLRPAMSYEQRAFFVTQHGLIQQIRNAYTRLFNRLEVEAGIETITLGEVRELAGENPLRYYLLLDQSFNFIDTVIAGKNSTAYLERISANGNLLRFSSSSMQEQPVSTVLHIYRIKDNIYILQLI